MPELLDPTSRITALCRERDITIASDDRRPVLGRLGRAVIGHVAPEAFLGGPIALVEDGDTIVIDVNTDGIDCPRAGRPRRGGTTGHRLEGGGRPTAASTRM